MTFNEECNLVNELIGKPYKTGSAGPDLYDCWGLAAKVQKGLFNRDLKTIDNPPTNTRELILYVRNHEAREQWKVAETPEQHGQLVELCHNTMPFHIGVYLNFDGGGIIHSQNPIGCCFDRIESLKTAGWRKFIFHDWQG